MNPKQQDILFGLSVAGMGTSFYNAYKSYQQNNKIDLIFNVGCFVALLSGTIILLRQ